MFVNNNPTSQHKKLGRLDSNQGSQIQSLLPYRLATPDYQPARLEACCDYIMLRRH